MLLALEGTTRDHGIGDDVPLADVDAMLALAARHGFHPTFVRKSTTPRPVARPDKPSNLYGVNCPILLPNLKGASKQIPWDAEEVVPSGSQRDALE